MRAHREAPLPDCEPFAEAERRSHGPLRRDRAGALPAALALVLAAVAVIVRSPEILGLG